jgi:hypothetical protein
MRDNHPTPSLSRVGDGRQDPWAPIDGLSDPARRILAHIRGRTITGRFACPLWNVPITTWQSALEELRHAGYRIAWTSGQVQDDPAVTGGYVLQ